MAIKSGFFNSVNGDRRYKADFFAEFFGTLIGNGVFPNPSTGLQVIVGSGMNVVLKAGKAWINGYYFANDADYSMQLDVADGVLKRIDRVVLRLDFLTRQIFPLIKKGTFASSPVAPALQRDADAFELGLADILVNNGAINLSQGNITDLRLNTALCGIVTGMVQQVDTTTVFNQYEAWFNSVKDGVDEEIDAWQASKYQEFEAWFADLQAMLDGDVAANLANRITQLESDFSTIPTLIREGVEQSFFFVTKSGKDGNGIFTTVEYRRKSDNTLVARSVLSGGTTPLYTTRTITVYEDNGIDVAMSVSFTISYDVDGDWISEV